MTLTSLMSGYQPEILKLLPRFSKFKELWEEVGLIIRSLSIFKPEPGRHSPKINETFTNKRGLLKDTSSTII